MASYEDHLMPTLEDSTSRTTAEVTDSKPSTHVGMTYPASKGMSAIIVKEESYQPFLKYEGLEISTGEDNNGVLYDKNISKPEIKDEHFKPNGEGVSKLTNSEVTPSTINEEHYESFMRCISSERIEEHSGITVKQEVLESFGKQNHSEGYANYNCESMAVQRTMINNNYSEKCQRLDNTGALSSGLNVIEVNNGVRSVTFLPEGTEFGPYPERSSPDIRTSPKDVDWPSFMRESCRKEQHNIEAVRRGGQVYYRTVTDIQPGTELVRHVLHTDSEPNIEHEYISIVEKPHHCLKCGKLFSNPEDLKQHSLIHIGVNECSDCGKQFATFSNLQQHKLTHTGYKPHMCVVCGRGFNLKSELKQHARIHTGDKPFKCPECDARFNKKWNVKLHQLTHTREKPHKCQECGESFLHKSELSNHSQAHAGDTSLKCGECGKYLANKKSLNQHMKTHTGEKLYKCQECGKCFTAKRNLTRHRLTHRGNVTNL